MAAVRTIGVSALVAFAGFAVSPVNAAAKTECGPGEGVLKDPNTCQACTGITVSADQALKCKDCDAGKVPNSDRTACEPCQAGKYASLSPAVPICKDCPVGTYSKEAANAQCEVCDEGRKFASDAGKTSKADACKKCDETKPTKCYKDGAVVDTEATGKTAIHDATAKTCKCPAGPTASPEKKTSEPWHPMVHETIGGVGGLIVGSGATYFITNRASSASAEAEVESQVLPACVIFTIALAAFAVLRRRRQGAAFPQVELTEEVAPAF